MPPSLQLVLTGKIDQEKQDHQSHYIKNRDQAEETIHRIAFHLPEKKHNILPGQ